MHGIHMHSIHTYMHVVYLPCMHSYAYIHMYGMHTSLHAYACMHMPWPHTHTCLHTLLTHPSHSRAHGLVVATDRAV